MPSTLTDRANQSVQPTTASTAEEEWTVNRLVAELTANGIVHAAISPNGQVWFDKVKPHVEEGQCTFEAFVAAFDDKGKTWREALEAACNVPEQPALGCHQVMD